MRELGKQVMTWGLGLSVMAATAAAQGTIGASGGPNWGRQTSELRVSQRGDHQNPGDTPADSAGTVRGRMPVGYSAPENQSDSSRGNIHTPTRQFGRWGFDAQYGGRHAIQSNLTNQSLGAGPLPTDEFRSSGWRNRGNGSFGQARYGAQGAPSDPQSGRGMQSMMNRLGIQAENGDPSFTDRGAPAQDRDRIAPSNRVQPPDAFHSGPTVSARVANDPSRLSNRGVGRQDSAVGPSSRLMSGGFGNGVDSSSFSNQFGNSPTASGLGRNDAMLNSGSAVRNGAAGNAGASYAGASSSSLLQGGSPSSLGGQAGSPSSINTIGSGVTGNGGGIAPGMGGVGVGTGQAGSLGGTGVGAGAAHGNGT